MKYEIRHMLKKGTGSIVNVSSTAGVGGGTLLAAYVASKHGVVGMTKSAAREYATKGIRINCLCPGWISTAMTQSILENKELSEKYAAGIPMNRPGRPEEIGEAVVWIFSDASSYMTGSIIRIDGGLLS